jgi:hypothetical protein
MKSFKENLIKKYWSVIGPVDISNETAVSFHGSQKPIEFYKTWEIIQDFYKEKSVDEIAFLEIGAYKGLWPLALQCFGEHNNVNVSYSTITLLSHDVNNQSLVETLKYCKNSGMPASLVNQSSHDTSSITLLKKKSYNIVFIDADHSYDAVMKDIKLYQPLATDMLIFHDIGRKTVSDAIRDSDIILDSTIMSDSKTHMGIGIKFI